MGRLGRRRLELVNRLGTLSEADVGAIATHPRLGQPMRLIDWAFFVAEHDDHHLASARQVASLGGGRAELRSLTLSCPGASRRRTLATERSLLASTFHFLPSTL